MKTNFASWRAALLGILWRLHLRDRRARNANLHLVGNLQNDRLPVKTVHRTVDAAGRDNFVSVFQRRKHILRFLALTLRRQAQHYVKKAPHDDHRQEHAEAAGPSASARLPPSRRCHRSQKSAQTAASFLSLITAGNTVRSPRASNFPLAF